MNALPVGGLPPECRGRNATLIEGPSPHELRHFLATQERRGRLVQLTEVQVTGAGRWGAYALLTAPLRPGRGWRKPALLAGGALVTLGALAGIGWWLVYAVLLPYLAWFAVLVPLGILGVSAALGGRERRGCGSSCETTIFVRHRHR